jgi:ERCC4-related helicase
VSDTGNIFAQPSWMVPAEEWFETNFLNGKISKIYAREIKESSENSQLINVDISTAFFNIKGWDVLRETLKDLNHVRLLIGVEPKFEENMSVLNPVVPSGQDILLRNEEMLRYGRDTIPIDKKFYALMSRFCEWLRQDNVEARIYTKGFLHAKTIHIKTEVKNKLIVGSANFTAAGLNRNIEAVTLQNDEKLIFKANSWFEDVWQKAEDYKVKLLELYENKIVPHEPELVFMKFLETYFEDNTYSYSEEDLSLSVNPWLNGLADFQQEGALKAQHCLDKYNGVLIADEVGLGKTYIAGALIKKAEREGKGVLIVAPPSIATSVWEKYVNHNKLSRNVQITTFDKMKENKLLDSTTKFDAADYSLLVVDEAHYLKNSNNRRYEAIINNILPNMRNPKIVFLTATPINNSLMDVYNLISLFLPDDFMEDKNIFSLYNEFYTKSKKHIEPSTQDWRWIWHLLDKVAVRRTRDFIRERKNGQKIFVNNMEWTFPDLQPPIKVEYGLSDGYRKFVNKVISGLNDLENIDGLSLTAYNLYDYLKREYLPPSPPPTSKLIRTTLLKRVESSIDAFKSTCETLLKKTDERIREIDEVLAQKILASKNVNNFDAEEYFDMEEKEFEVEFADDVEEENIENSKTNPTGKIGVLHHGMFTTEKATKLLIDLKADRKILQEWFDEATKLTELELENDYKFMALVKQLNQIGLDHPEPYERNLRKVVIFTSSAKTAEALKTKLEKYIKENKTFEGLNHFKTKLPVECVTGSASTTAKTKALEGFAPESMSGALANKEKQKQDFGDNDILIATDVLAEGVNLQQAGKIINYDLPWNPMKVVQRIGRIDRILSEHNKIYNYVFFPKGDLYPTYFKLYSILKRKADLATATLGQKDVTGAGSNGASSAIININKTTTDEEEMLETLQIDYLYQGRQIKRQIDIGELESLKQLYLKYTEEMSNKEKIEQLSQGARTVFVSDKHNETAWVFCIKIDHPDMNEGQSTVRFATVDLQNNVTIDTLHALKTSDPRVNQLIKAKDVLHEEFQKAHTSPNHDFNDLFKKWKQAEKLIIEEWNTHTAGTASSRTTLSSKDLKTIEQEIKKQRKLDLITTEQEKYLTETIHTTLLTYEKNKIETIIKTWEEDRKHYKQNKDELELGMTERADLKRAKEYLEKPLTVRLFDHMATNQIKPHNKNNFTLKAENIKLITWAHILPMGEQRQQVLQETLKTMQNGEILNTETVGFPDSSTITTNLPSSQKLKTMNEAHNKIGKNLGFNT